MTPVANSVPNQALWNESMETAIGSGEWTAYREFLLRALDKAVERVALRTGEDRIRALRAEPMFLRAMDLEAFIALFPDHYLASLASDSTREDFMRWLLQGHPTALGEMLAALSPSDEPAAVIDIWSSIWYGEENESHRDRYRALALACALVYDSSGSCGDPATAEKRYALFRDNAERGRLTGNIHRMKAPDLVWVVDIDIPESEIDWALDNIRYPQSRWGQAYGDIEYLMERAVNGLNPYSEYTFAEIKRHGGICGDQSFYCANSAKAHGIPAAILTGDGDRGPHAWVVWMPDLHTWSETGGYGYRTGSTRHPQTNESFPQSMFEMASDRRSGRDRLENVRVFVRFARLFDTLARPDWGDDALNAATRLTPDHPLPWLLTINRMEAKPETTLEEWEKLAATLRRRFRDRPDFLLLAENIEDEYIHPARDPAHNARDIVRDRRRLTRNQAERSDLVAASVERQANILAANKDWDGLTSLYRQAFRDYGGRAEAFRALATQYFDHASPDPERMTTAAREIEAAFKRHIETTEKEYFKATTEIRIMRQIAGYHDQSGNQKRGDTLRRRAEQREKTTTRRAL